jgi:hypothetical protein
MNDLDQNDMHTGEAYQTPPKPRLRARRRWGGRVFAFGAFLLLTTGISLGASRHHAQHRQALRKPTRRSQKRPGAATNRWSRMDG